MQRCVVLLGRCGLAVVLIGGCSDRVMPAMMDAAVDAPADGALAEDSDVADAAVNDAIVDGELKTPPSSKASCRCGLPEAVPPLKCQTNAECNDGNGCTTDTCTMNMCSNTMPDSGMPDGGAPDSGMPDGGTPDGGTDSGPADGGPDASISDSGPMPDGGVTDAGIADGGPDAAVGPGRDDGCDCSSTPGDASAPGLWLAVGLCVVIWRRRRRR